MGERVSTGDRLHGIANNKWAALGVWVLVALLALLMTVRASTVVYSPDSWAAVDIARSLLDRFPDIGSIQGARNYVNVPWLNDSFPFLWPATLAPGIALLGSAAPVGGYIFVGIWLATVLVIQATVEVLSGPRTWGPLVGIALLALPQYANEGHAGRSVPMTILLLAIALWLLARVQVRGSSRGLAIGIGVALGLCAANRFDALLYGPLFITLAWWITALRRNHVVVSLVAWAMFPALWMAYSLSRLGGLYVTDNARVAALPVTSYVSDWPAVFASERTSISGTLSKMSGNVTLLADSVVNALSWWLLAALVGAAVAVVLVLLERSNGKGLSGRQPLDNTTTATHVMSRFAIYLAFGLGIVQALLVLLTAYGTARYWAPATFSLLEGLAIAAMSRFRSGPQWQPEKKRHHFASWFGLAMIAVLALVGSAQTVKEFRAFASQANADAALVQCLGAVNGVTLVAGDDDLAARIAATSDQRTARVPDNFLNMNAAHWESLSREYGVKYWLNATEDAAWDMPVAANESLGPMKCLEGGAQVRQQS